MTTPLRITSVRFFQACCAIPKRIMVRMCIVARVLGGKLMAVAAMSPCILGSSSCCATDSDASVGAYATKDVFSGCYSFDVPGIDTASNTAKVIDIQSFRDRPDEHLVRKSVSRNHSFANPESRIASIVAGQFPKPTTGHRLHRNRVHESFEYAESSHVILLKSLWSGLRGATNAVAARSYFTAFSDPARCF